MSEEKNTEKTEKKTKAKDTKKGVSFEALSSLDAPVSFWKGIPFGLQHVMAMFVANLAPIFLVATAAKMDAAKMTSAQSAAVIQSGLLVAGLGTCLQLYGVWLIGSRLPMVTGISFTYVAAAMSIAQHQGYGAVAGAVVLGGLLEVVLGLTAKYWRRFVPPIVSAIVVTSIGFSLLSVGATSFGGGSGAGDADSLAKILRSDYGCFHSGGTIWTQPEHVEFEGSNCVLSCAEYDEETKTITLG